MKKKSKIFEMDKCGYCDFDYPNLELEVWSCDKNTIKICQTCRENFEQENGIKLVGSVISDGVFKLLHKFCE